MDKISIIIPVYNAAKYLKRCIDSIVSQSYENIEIICVNDGSTDNSLNILKEYADDKRIVIISKENAGVSSARNDAIKASTGDYIAFVDSDDWLEQDAIECLYNAIKEKNVDVVRANYYKEYVDNKQIKSEELCDLKDKVYRVEDEDFDKLVIDRLLNGTLQCYLWLLLIKKEYIIDKISFREDIKLMEDTIFYIELLSSVNSIYFMDKPIYHYFCNQDSCTRSSSYYIRNMNNLVKVNQYLNDIIKCGEYNDEKRIETMNTVHLNMIMGFFFLMVKNKNVKNSELIIEMIKIIEDERVQKLVGASNMKLLPIHLRIPIILIINKKYKLLFQFYNLRKALSYTKDFITRRRN